MGGPIKAALLALKNIGGQLNIFQTRLPTVGPGALKHRDEAKFQGTDKEKTLYVPQDVFYRNTAEEAVDAGIGINLFLFPSQFIDVASLGVLAGLTGGDVFFYPRFDPVRDAIKLRSQIERVLTRETAYCVTARIRCSEGTFAYFILIHQVVANSIFPHIHNRFENSGALWQLLSAQCHRLGVWNTRCGQSLCSSHQTRRQTGRQTRCSLPVRSPLHLRKGRAPCENTQCGSTDHTSHE